MISTSFNFLFGVRVYEWEIMVQMGVVMGKKDECDIKKKKVVKSISNVVLL